MVLLLNKLYSININSKGKFKFFIIASNIILSISSEI